MGIHVDPRRIEFEEQHEDRMPSVVEHVAVGAADRGRQHPVPHRPAVDKEELLVGLRAGAGRRTQPPPQAQPGTLPLDLEGMLREVPAQQRRYPRRAPVGTRGRQLQHRAAVVPQLETDVRPDRRMGADHVLAVQVLGALRTQELAPGGDPEEQVADLHGGPRRVCRGFDIAEDIRPVAGKPPAAARTGLRGGQEETRHRGDRRQGLAAESQRPQRLEVAHLRDLAGRVPRQCERQFPARDPAAVVAHPDQPDPALLQVHAYPARTGVDAVLDQLLDHRGGTLDHLAGGDLTDQLWVKPLYWHDGSGAVGAGDAAAGAAAATAKTTAEPRAAESARLRAGVGAGSGAGPGRRGTGRSVFSCRAAGSAAPGRRRSGRSGDRSPPAARIPSSGSDWRSRTGSRQDG